MILFFCGSIGGCGWFLELIGRSTFTAWVWIGMVMMNMMSSTSMTSISGVVFISIIGSPSSAPALMDMAGLLLERDQVRGLAPGAGSEMKPTRAKPARCIVKMVPPMHR